MRLSIDPTLVATIRLPPVSRPSPARWRGARLSAAAAALWLAVAGAGMFAAPLATPSVASERAPGVDSPGLDLRFAGAPAVAFSPSRDACDGHDIPDAPLRAFRDAGGEVVAFGLHYVNRRLRGPDLASLRVDCAVVLGSGRQADPAAHDDLNWITATWTDDGRDVAALVHHEYHANRHPGRCAFDTMMQCWMNTITAWRSRDGGGSFARSDAAGFVVAAAPFVQSEHQGRHRGFFNPSNIVARGGYKYFMASNTGWPGQPHGVCLFRNADPHDPAGWRAFDGKTFSIAYGDPYRPRRTGAPAACQPVAPFPAPVGSIVRHRPSGLWLAVFMASADARYFPVSGFYFATSANLTRWSAPRLLLAGRTLYDDPCASGGRLIAYPSLLDPRAQGRNFDDAGDRAQLFYAAIGVDGCAITSRRVLMRQSVSLAPSR